MKKTVLFAAIMALALALCACDNNTPAPAPTFPEQTSPTLQIETEPTEVLPTEVIPTEEELAMLEAYADVYGLLDTIDGDFNAYYETLISLDADVLARWGNTEYAPATSYGDAINWDLNEVLANFTVIENVLLEQRRSTTDKVGNVSHDNTKVSWLYDQNGAVRSVVNEVHANYLIEEFPENLGPFTVERDETGKIIKVVYGSGNWVNDIIAYNYDETGRLASTTRINNSTTEECATYTHDAAGNLTRIECGSSVYNYTYREDGQLNTSEHNFYIQDRLYTQTVMNFSYDEQGVLVSATERRDQYNYSFFSGLNQLETTETHEHTYTCDELGNMVKDDIKFGPTYYASGAEAGTIKAQSPLDTVTYEYDYGNFCIYNAEEETMS